MGKYYMVTAKFGHVKNKYYVEKAIPVIAENGSEASQKVKKYPRVKKHLKNCITSCMEIDYEQYLELKQKINEDGYFKSRNHKEQRMNCPEMQKVELVSEYYEYPKKTHIKRRLLEQIRIDEMLRFAIGNRRNRHYVSKV
jgi:hypothetical protein